MQTAKSSVQEDYLEFLEKYSGRWNQFDGPRIVEDLRAARHLWRAVVMAQNPLHPWRIGILLRDFQWNRYAVDTLYILTDESDFAELEELAQRWKADDVEIIRNEAEVAQFLGLTSPKGTVIYSLWWD